MPLLILVKSNSSLTGRAPTLYSVSLRSRPSVLRPKTSLKRGQPPRGILPPPGHHLRRLRGYFRTAPRLLGLPTVTQNMMEGIPLSSAASMRGKLLHWDSSITISMPSPSNC